MGGVYFGPPPAPACPGDAEREVVVSHPLHLSGYPEFARSHAGLTVILPVYRARIQEL